MIKKILVLVLAFFSFFSVAFCEKIVNVADFGIEPNGKDNTPALRKLLSSLGDEDYTLVFPKGKYNFGPDMAYEKYLFVSNNDEGLKRIIFPFIDMENVSIDGGGSTFIFYGFVNPFVVEDSKNITFKNFTVDVARSFHSEGIIEETFDGGIVVRIPENFPYRVRDGILEFTDGRPENAVQTTVTKEAIFEHHGLLEFDTNKRETAFMAPDIWNIGKLRAEDLGNRRVKIFLSRAKGTIGNTMVFSCGHRNYPTFVASSSENVTFDNITINASGGMGILGQNVENVYVKNCKVTPSNGRMISCTADATHFVNCSGEIVLDNNLFENQMDDATNIHGIYEQIVSKEDDKTILTRLVHPQQFGFKTFKDGDKVEFVHGKSMITYADNTISKVEKLNKEFTKLTFKNPLSSELKIGDAIATIRNYPRIQISNNYIGKNRARGMLLNCRGKTVVEKNVFHSPGAALLFEGDACFWFEQGGVRDCVIRENRFENCRFGVWGKGVIEVAAGIKENFDKSRYNRNILIENNTFVMFDDCPLLNIYCVDSLIWRNNKIEKSSAYPKRDFKDTKRFIIKNSDNIKIDDK